nr:gametocyte-specific factor 1-like [Nerophis lumbriciformis]
MTTIKFGSSIGSCRQGGTDVGTFDEEPEINNCDPDKLVQCPFDKSHQIRVCRLSYHLMKCKKNHPQLAKELKTCPFNACHLVPKHELAQHTKTCPNRTALFTKEDGNDKWGKRDVPVMSQAQFNADMSEDWEKEIDKAAVPFIWSAELGAFTQQGYVKPQLNQS